MSRPRVSILMPVHNEERFLPAALASVRNQTMTDWELVAVNDHPTDETPTILAAAANLLAARLEHLHDPEQIEACLADFLPAWAVPLGLDDAMLAGMVAATAVLLHHVAFWTGERLDKPARGALLDHAGRALAPHNEIDDGPDEVMRPGRVCRRDRAIQVDQELGLET